MNDFPEWVETYEDYLDYMAAYEYDNPPIDEQENQE